MKKVVVLVGAPATGKSTLAMKLEAEHGYYRLSFDELFPVDTLAEVKSKTARQKLLEMIESCDSEYAIIDDTTHMHSIQKRYFSLQATVCLLYLHVETNQIPVLLQRNAQRSTSVSDDDILNICSHLSAHPPINRNLLQFNFASVPTNINKLLTENFVGIQSAPKPDFFPLQSNEPNALHELNNRLNAAVHAAFQRNPRLDGRRLSLAKKQFLASHHNVLFSELDNIVEEFVQNNLC